MAEGERAPFYKKWWFWVIVAIIVIAFATTGGDDEDANPSDTNETETNNDETTDVEEDPAPTDEADEEDAGNVEEQQEPDEPETTNEPDPEPETNEATIESGTYVVGEEIEPGVYRTEGNVTYWERLAGFSGELDDIIVNGTPSGPFIVEISDSDTGFRTQGRGEWVKIDLESYQGENLTEFSDGLFLVGKDIQPGTYKSSGGGDLGGYWARLSDLSGELDDIISNGNVDGSTIVEISEGDVAFQSSGGLTWSKVE